MRDARALGGVVAGVMLALTVVVLSQGGAASGPSLAAATSSAGSNTSQSVSMTTAPTAGVPAKNTSTDFYAAVVGFGDEAASPSDLASLPRQSTGLNLLVIVPFVLAALLATVLYRVTARRREESVEPV